MRSLISILILLMLFQPAGYLFIFKIQQYQVRKEIKQRIKAGVPEEELVLLEIPRFLEEEPNQTFHRIHNREFRYHGRMYDIVRQERHGDTTWYYCIRDDEETRLFANLDEFVKQDMARNPERKKQSEDLLRLLSALFLNLRNDNSFASSVEDFNPTSYRFRVKTWTGPPLTPPPRG